MDAITARNTFPWAALDEFASGVFCIRAEVSMPAPYSMDLRARVIEACDELGLSDLEAAETYKIGEATVRRWRRKVRETGTVEPLPHAGGNPARIDAAEHARVREIVAEKSDATIQEIRDTWATSSGKDASRSAMVRTLAKLGLSRKKSR